MSAVASLLDRISDRFCVAGAWLLLALAVLINVEVALRYGFGSSTLIADEYGGYLYVWMTLFGFAQALRSGAFIRVELFIDRRSPRTQAACEAFAALVGLLVAAVLCYACWLLFHGSLRFGTRSIQPSATPLWTMQIVLPLGLAWLCLLYAEAFTRSVLRLRMRMN